jgi:hypothetical protein
MNHCRVVGMQPWLPPPLSHSPWWTLPVPAERLAALRIGVAIVLFLDVLGTYLPRTSDFFGADSLTAPGTYTEHVAATERHRVLLDSIESAAAWQGLLIVWAAAAVCLGLGVLPRLAAAVAWFLSISITRLNPDMHNSGDQVRNILLFFLMLSPCGAIWTLSTWRQRPANTEAVLIHPWPLRLLLLQLVAIYFMNGVYKLRGEHWQDGTALAQALGDSGWTRWSFADWPRPAWLLQFMSWTVLAWELGFPLCMWIPRLRVPALVFGVLFHVGTGITMRLGPFPLYMLCLYLPLLPWEASSGSAARSP